MRALGHEASENILQAVILFPYISDAHSPGHLALILYYNFVFKVRELLRDRSMLKTEANAVTVLDGTQEGSYQWVCCPTFVNVLQEVILLYFLCVCVYTLNLIVSIPRSKF